MDIERGGPWEEEIAPLKLYPIKEEGVEQAEATVEETEAAAQVKVESAAGAEKAFKQPEKTAVEIAAEMGLKQGEKVKVDKFPLSREQMREEGIEQPVRLFDSGWLIEGFLKEKDGSVMVFLKREKPQPGQPDTMQTTPDRIFPEAIFKEKEEK